MRRGMATLVGAFMVLMAVGALALPGLVVGDAQWQYHTDKQQCDNKHYIYTYFPKKGDGELGKVQFKIPCGKWFKYNKGDTK